MAAEGTVTTGTRVVAVLTSGGDAPGMNAAIRAVVRAGAARGFEMIGVLHGFTGLIGGEFRALGPRDVGGIVDRGGTVLGTTRCLELKTESGQQRAVQQLRRRGIEALVVIGGDGSQSGAHALHARGVAVIGVASTIDNDLRGTDVSIGATTAAEIAVEAIDRLRVTAASHQRGFLVEVMGRHCGYLAMLAGIAGGAEAIVVPEMEMSPEAVAAELRTARSRGKSHAIVVVAEGARHNADALEEYFKGRRNTDGYELRVTRLGHVQRGGKPCVFDRLLATRLGIAAIDCIAAGQYGQLLGIVANDVIGTPLADVAGRPRGADTRLLETAMMLAR
ncbi:MAG TPA: ATP-dependent 6-phosphofructokinase [Pseudomonadales bacterium]|nr:ATP-dependent 6-phosphofructokinase [Pseudomonadales bacterium]